MFTNFLKVLFGGRAVKAVADVAMQRHHIRCNAAALRAMSRFAYSSRHEDERDTVERQSLKQVRSSWTHGRYDPVPEVSVQQQINMMYAPVVHSLVETEASVSDAYYAAAANIDEQLDFSPFSSASRFERVTSNDMEQNKRLKPVGEILAEISLHPSEDVRFCVASNQNTPEVGLRALVNDSSDRVKLALLTNPCCPADVAKLLICDNSSMISFNAVKRIQSSWTNLEKIA